MNFYGRSLRAGLPARDHVPHGSVAGEQQLLSCELRVHMQQQMYGMSEYVGIGISE